MYGEEPSQVQVAGDPSELLFGTGHGGGADEPLLLAIGELQVAAGCHSDEEALGEEEMLSYADALARIGELAEQGGLPALAEGVALLTDRLIAATDGGADEAREVREALTAFCDQAFIELELLAEAAPGEGAPSAAGAALAPQPHESEYTEESWTAAAPQEHPPLQLPRETARVDAGILELLAEEAQPVLELFHQLLGVAAEAESAEEVAETIETANTELEGLARGTEMGGLAALTALLRLIQRRLTEASRGDTARAACAAMQELPLHFVNYLEHPDSAGAASQLVGLLDGIAPADAAALTAALTAVEVSRSRAPAELRPVQAQPEDVRLDLPDDINPELLDGLLSELPVQTGAFAQATQHIVEGHGTREDIEVAKRAAHTLKGAANTVGVRGIANLTHHLEDILVALSTHGVLPNLGLSQTLSYASDCLEAMSEAVAGTGEPPGDAVNVLQDVLNWANRIDAQGIEVAQGEPPREVHDDAEHEQARGRIERDAVPMLRVPAHLIDELLRLVGETMTSAAQIQNRLTLAVQQARSISRQNARFQQLAAELESLVDLRGGALLGVGRMDGSAAHFDTLEFEQYTELHTLSRQLIEVATDSREMGLTNEEHLAGLTELLNQQGRLHLENQNAVMSTRMVPVSTVVSRLQRSVRQACRILDKEVELRVRGEQTVIDGNLLHELLDALMHLLRNAVDHGIEAVDQRRAQGKPAVGQIELQFRREGDYITVRCRDDGQGLDLDAIRRSAERKGLIEPGAMLSEDEVARLTLIPGFSTREDATQVSGRGIGMDAVNAKVIAFKGSLNLVSRRGVGLTVEIRLPVTLLSTHALLVRIRNKVLALSTRGVEDIHYVETDRAQKVGNQLIYVIGDKPHEVIELEEVLMLPGDRRKDRIAGRPVLMVRLETGAERAVIVQEVLESRNLVVKGLGPYVPKIHGIIGATILGDGSVAPVFDLPELLHAPAQLLRPGAAPVEAAVSGGSEGARQQRVLVVDDSISARRAAAQVVRDAGYEVRSAGDGLEAVNLVQNWLPDFVITDMEMPRMNGFELTRNLRAQERTRRLPVVMITSRASEKHRQQAQLAGVDRYLTKPFSERDLIAQLEALAQR